MAMADQSTAQPAHPTVRFDQKAGQSVLEVAGAWTVFTIREVGKLAAKARTASGARKVAVVDASGVERLDTAGALEILAIAGGGPDTEIQTDEEKHAELFKLVQGNMSKAPPEPPSNWIAGWFEDIGRSVVELLKQSLYLCAFLGEVVVTFGQACLSPRRFRFPAVVKQMYEVWIRALTIVGVLCFLIGVVIAYQGVQQLRQFGAETFAVEATAIAIFRELGVLFTAIIVAGRSGSAFTAQIGTMQVNLEIDAMRTMGLHPVEWLVLPRILALTFALPLLTFWGDMAGLLGGAFACTIYLDMSVAQFFERLRDTVAPWNFYTGMIKAPVFGIVIAGIGCYEGLQVKGSAESVGQLTTKSVVEAIFCVIVLDAIFSVIFLLANV
jgi:phospholipid/cholesterol/gamma-HCH transport system permease protein